MFAQVVGTLVGVFVTSSGIMLAADTAVTRSATAGGVVFERKLEVTGERSGAVFTGSAGWEVKSRAANFRAVFREASAQLRRAGAGPVATQVETLIGALRREAESNVFPGIAASFPDGDVLTVLVAGYDGPRPEVQYARLRIERRASSFSVQTHRVSHCWILAGKPEAALGLIDDDARLPAALRRQSPVVVLRDRRGCQESLTETQARDFFLVAVDATAVHGVKFGIPAGSVGGDVDVLRISPAGAVTVERIPRL
jgi:hypothetical protein